MLCSLFPVGGGGVNNFGCKCEGRYKRLLRNCGKFGKKSAEMILRVSLNGEWKRLKIDISNYFCLLSVVMDFD